MSQLKTQTRKLFQHVNSQWLLKPDLKPGFLNTLDGYTDLQKNLRDDSLLSELSREMYPAAEFDSISRSRAEQERQELHEILNIIQTMEATWLGAKLDRFDSHPLNGGWVAVFHRWASMPKFRRLWPIVRCDFGRDFIRYCESRFSLEVSYSPLQPLPPVATRKRASAEQPEDDPVRRLLHQEFRLEWPEIPSEFLTSGHCRVWYVTPGICLPGGDVELYKLNGTPLGFIALLPAGSRSPRAGRKATSSWAESAPEVRLWVRPQHRFLGVGRHLMNALATLIAPESDSRDDRSLRLSPGKRNSLLKHLGVHATEDGETRNLHHSLVTRYFERSGQSAGQDLRRQMQLGFLYDYSFRRQNATGAEPYAGAGDSPQDATRRDRITATNLETTFNDFVEASRALAPRLDSL